MEYDNQLKDNKLSLGIHGNKIGSDASRIPASDNFFYASIPTCNIEHFENETVIGFMNKMECVLQKGGKCIIVPLNVYKKTSCQTDRQYSVPGDVTFNEGVDIYCAKNCGNRHGRFYSIITLIERLIKPNTRINLKMFLLKKSELIDRSGYYHFLLLGEKI